MDEKTALDTAIELLGGVTAATQKLGLKNYQTIQQWRVSGVPSDWCLELERATDGRVTVLQLKAEFGERLAAAGYIKVAHDEPAMAVLYS